VVADRWVQSLSIAFVLQLACQKCSQIKSDNLSPTCSCGGSFRETAGRYDTKKRLKSIVSSEFAEYRDDFPSKAKLTNPDL
jgi:hypothetical protein